MNWVACIVLALVFLLLIIAGWWSGYSEGVKEGSRESDCESATWVRIPGLSYREDDDTVHVMCECPRCGYKHEFIDGLAYQYRYCPQCRLKLNGEIK